MSRWTLAVLLAAAVTTSSCDLLGLCANEVVTAATSPSGARSAVVFVRDCGPPRATAAK
jgi:hypothetical protein